MDTDLGGGDLTGVDLALPATTFAGLTGLFFSALRAPADGAGFARTAADGFDFAAIFFGLATALAMTENNPLKMKEWAPYTTLSAPAQAAATYEATSKAQARSGR